MSEILMRLTRTKWFLPGCSLLLGLAAFASFWAGDRLRAGLVSLGIMSGFGVLVLLGGRSETIRGLRGDGRDERLAWIDRTATFVAGQVLLGAVLGLTFWEWVHGRDGTPYAPLGGLAGVAYLVALGALRWRR